jgi:hypothetical protein
MATFLNKIKERKPYAVDFFFRFLLTGLSFRNLVTTLRMGASTVSRIVHETCTVLWEELVQDSKYRTVGENSKGLLNMQEISQLHWMY